VHAQRYRITVKGKLGEASVVAFEGMKVTYEAGRTVLVADLDQSSLYGVLQRIYTLALELVSVMPEGE
jgi:hypothetical protein